MSVSDEVRSQLALQYKVLFPQLDERQRRLMMEAEARIVGHGGIRAVARSAQVGETTVRKGGPSWRTTRNLWAGAQARWWPEGVRRS